MLRSKTNAKASAKTGSTLIKVLSVGKSLFLVVVLAGFSFSLALVLVFKLSACKFFSVFSIFVFAFGQSFG